MMVYKLVCKCVAGETCEDEGNCEEKVAKMRKSSSRDEEKVRMRKISKVVVKMNMSSKMKCVLECISNAAVPEIHFAALLKLKAPARTISVESTLALNPSCFDAKVV